MEAECATDTVTKLDEDITKDLESLYEEDKFDEIISLTTKELITNKNNKELYIWRGHAFYKQTNYTKAIKNYNKALEIDPEYELALYDRGLAYFANKEYDKAINDYDAIIKNNSQYAYKYYHARGNAKKGKEDYYNAIIDYTESISKNKNFENAYYDRGLAKYATYTNLEESKKDFTEYLRLTNKDNEDDEDNNKTWITYANSYIETINEEINEPKLSIIRELIDNIKKTLLVKEEYITHYTSFTNLKKFNTRRK